MEKDNKEIRLGMSLEDYLETIFILSEKNESVRVTDISNKLKKSKPSVNTSIKILARDGYLEHEHYGRVTLTESGRALARDIYSRHKTIKTFFVDILGIDPVTADKEACSIEHVLSTASIGKLDEYISTVLKERSID